MRTKPVIGISMGDPAGVGPEIIAKALARREVHEMCCPIVIGSAEVIRQAAGTTGVQLEVRPTSAVNEIGVANVWELGNVDVSQLELGKVSAIAGHAAFEAVRVMIELAMNGVLDATVTAPINKEALVAAGHHFPGHTEIFAHFTDTRDFTMMLAAENRRANDPRG